jgi:hypothetical protein
MIRERLARLRPRARGRYRLEARQSRSLRGRPQGGRWAPLITGAKVLLGLVAIFLVAFLAVLAVAAFGVALGWWG